MGSDALSDQNALTEILRTCLADRKMRMVDSLGPAIASEVCTYCETDSHYSEVGHAEVADRLCKIRVVRGKSVRFT